MLRLLGIVLVMWVAQFGVARAQSVQDQIVSQLQDQGFHRIEVSRTWLGRVRLKATSADLERELVFNPVTGEILRDYWEDIDSNGRSGPRLVDPTRRNRDNGRGGRANRDEKGDDDRGRGERDRDDDEDDDDDEDEDDEDDGDDEDHDDDDDEDEDEDED